MAELPGGVRPLRRETVHRHYDCNSQTRMAVSHAELLALNPQHFTALYCAFCDKLVPISEMEWADDGTQVGS